MSCWNDFSYAAQPRFGPGAKLRSWSAHRSDSEVPDPGVFHESKFLMDRNFHLCLESKASHLEIYCLLRSMYTIIKISRMPG